MPDSPAERFLGGSPLTVVVRLGALSLLVGALMSWLGVDALDILNDVQHGFAHLYGTGFAALRGIAQTALAGAAVVLPVWFLVRIFNWRGPRQRPVREARRDDTPPRWSNPDSVRD